jgi:hypothetical protein
MKNSILSSVGRLSWRTGLHAACLVLGGGTLCGQMIVADSFNYPNGPIVGAPGSPWVNNYLPTDEANVVAGRLFLTQAESESVRVNFASQVSTGLLYASFSVTFTGLPSEQGNFIAFFRQTSVDNLRARVWVRTNNAAAGKFRLGMKAFNSPPDEIPTDLSLGETLRLVVRYNVTNHNSTLWINPTNEADTTLRVDSVGLPGLAVGVMHFGFLQTSNFGNAGGMGSLFVDDLKIARRFVDVTTAVALTRIVPKKPGAFELYGEGVPGAGYTVLATDSLATPVWTDIGTANADPGGVVFFTDEEAEPYTQRFYRLQGQ